MRLHHVTMGDRTSNRLNFCIRYVSGTTRIHNDEVNTGSRDNVQVSSKLESNEYITGEKGQRKLLSAVLPLPLYLVKRKEGFEAIPREVVSYGLLVLVTSVDRRPLSAIAWVDICVQFSHTTAASPCDVQSSFNQHLLQFVYLLGPKRRAHKVAVHPAGSKRRNVAEI